MIQQRPGLTSGKKLKTVFLSISKNSLSSLVPNSVIGSAARASLNTDVTNPDPVYLVGLLHFSSPMVMNPGNDPNDPNISIMNPTVNNISVSGWIDLTTRQSANDGQIPFDYKFNLLAMTKDWDPTTVTWNNQPDVIGITKLISVHIDFTPDPGVPFGTPPPDFFGGDSPLCQIPFEFNLIPLKADGTVPSDPSDVVVKTTYYGLGLYVASPDLPANCQYAGVIQVNLQSFDQNNPSYMQWDRNFPNTDDII